MTTSHDNPTWRDLADQLTPEQVLGLELIERECGSDGRTPALVLDLAKASAEA